jgi:tetratricopeptide (TPR) repeat protein
MKTLKLVALSLTGVAVLSLSIRSWFSVASPQPSITAASEVSAPGRAEKRILLAQRAIDRSPEKSDGYNQLAAAYMMKARETADLSFNSKAEEAIARSLQIEPDNYDALKLRAKLQLTNHRFQAALETAHQALSIQSDDHDVWGQITDAYVELGDYDEAVRAAQKMMDLRPDSSSYARVSYLRSLHGDTYGAVQAMRAAVKAADPNDPEAMAWCRVHLASELINAGKVSAAENELDQALQIFPRHHLAMEAKARLLIVKGDVQGSISAYEQLQLSSPSADAALILGDLYAHLEKEDQATRNYALFESMERENAAVENSWRHMVNYWLDHDRELGQALALAKREYEERKDIFTCDTLAWAYFKKGELAKAKNSIEEALRTGTRDFRINYHAGMIYRALNLRDRAVRHLKIACAINSSFDLLQTKNARKMLADLNQTREPPRLSASTRISLN